jgi:hypothetical protein
VELPSRINEMCLMRGDEGLFLAAACNDGSLPVLAVENVVDDDDDDDDDDSTNNNKETGERRAIMAIEPVDGPVAGEERFKCIQTVSGYYVVTANSIGVISLMNLQGAVNMIMSPQSEDNGSDDDDDDDSKNEETPESDSDDDEEEELAVDIIDSVQLGSGARITCLAAWSYLGDEENASEEESDDDVQEEVESPLKEVSKQERAEERTYERVGTKRKHDEKEVTMDPEALARAKMLVSDAKKIQKRNERKKGKKQR